MIVFNCSFSNSYLRISASETTGKVIRIYHFPSLKKLQESVLKVEKVLQNLRKYEKVCQNLRKLEKVWECVVNANAKCYLLVNANNFWHAVQKYVAVFRGCEGCVCLSLRTACCCQKVMFTKSLISQKS